MWEGVGDFGTIVPMQSAHDPRALRRNRIISAIAILLALIGWLSVGARLQRHQAEQRGIWQITDPPLPNSQATIGLNVALEQYGPDALRANLEEIEALGVRHLKQHFFVSPQFDWESADRIFAAVGRHEQLSLVPVLDGDPQANFAPPDLAEFERWLTDFIGRYGGEIDAYIVWDEPNLSEHWGGGPVNPDAYGALVATAARLIDAADPGATLVLAPLAPTTEDNANNRNEAAYLQALFDNGTMDLVDVVALKPYGFDQAADDRAVENGRLNFSRAILLRELLVANGRADTAIWAGNWGWNSLPDDWGWGRIDMGRGDGGRTAGLYPGRLCAGPARVALDGDDVSAPLGAKPAGR